MGKSPRTPSVVFPKIKRVDADKDIPHLIKYLVNYGFYRFGIEICLVCYIIVIGSRMDLVACFYSVWLCTLFYQPRVTLAKYWNNSTIFMLVIIPIQYILLIGLPPGLCVNYPWLNVKILEDFNNWAMLPQNTLDFKAKSKNLIKDYILLVLLCRQLIVFRIETRYDSTIYAGGSNKSVLDDIDKLGTKSFVNPTKYDFIDKIRNYLDILKRFVFIMFFWCTLAIVFLTGTNRVNLFSIGYIIGSFTFLWQGTDFYLRPIHTILKWWNYLIGYNVTIVTIKTMIQMLGCLFLDYLKTSNCWFVQMFGITCLCSLNNPPPEADTSDDTCMVPLEDAGLLWDGVCFAFLMLQRRMFSSHYFCYVINEAKASLILASRGNELIEDLRSKEMKLETERESQILQKIKTKMDRIKATQQRILEEHDTKTHAAAIRSGDYYMFEDVEDEFELDLFNQKESDDEEDKKSATRRRLSKKMTFGQLMTKMKEDAEKERIEQEEQELLEKQKKIAMTARRCSSPAFQIKQTTSEIVPVRAVNSEPIARHSQFDPASSSIGIETNFDDETEGLMQADGQKPSTSRGILDDEDSSGSEQKLIKNDSIEEEDLKKESDLAKKKQFLIDKLMLIPTFLSSILCSITLRLHSVSRSYRYVMRVLAREKRILKHSPGFGAGFRTGASMIWTPIQNAKSSRDSPPRSEQNDQAVVSRRSSKSSVISVSSNCLAQAESYSRVEDRTDRDSIISSPARLDTEFGSPSKLIKNDRTAEVEDLTQEVVIDVEENYEIDEDDFASKEHSIIVELFQALWYVILSHTDFICYTAVFVNQINSASILSIPLPLMVLLWGTLTFPRPSKTFWVTLIAYTQTVVLLKCLSQFEVLPWNQINLPNQPFAPAKILGIERKKGYATYDLILLLMIFVHRIILKSLGLWKSDVIASTEDVAIQNKYKASEAIEQTQKEILQTENDKAKLSIESKNKSVEISEESLVIEQIEEDASTDFISLIKISFQKYLSSAKCFLAQLFDRQSRKTADVYGLLFLCDFVNFFVILFGFSAFGTQEGDGGVMSYFEENKVPITFLLMLIIQFFLIVIDRALYLRKYMMGKIIFQLFLVIGLHIWMFFILPATTERIFNSTNPPVTYYLIKCLYLLFSAYQIRCGYPARILGNFLTKGFNIMNNVGFKVFMIIPFLFELRTLMDWVWTDTSMTLFDWLKMEDIFVNVYQLKCSRQLEGDLPAPRGQKKGPMVKYLMGGGMILGVIAVIWFPMALFAFSNTVGEPNIPYDVSVSLRIGPYEPVYVMSAQDSDIFQLTEQNWDNFLQPYFKDKSALTFLSNYEHVDVAAVKLGSNSSTIWNISPPDKDRLLDDLKSNGTLTCRFRYTITRVSNSKENPPVISEEKSYELLSSNVVRLQLTEMLEGNKSVSVALPNLFPKFLKVKNSGSLKPAHQLLKAAQTDDDDGNYRNLSMRLLQTDSNTSLPQYWWEARELCGDVDPDYKSIFSMMPYSDCLTHITIYLFNDKIFPSTLGAIAGGGIIGLYTTLIFFFSRFLRGSIFSGSSSKIMFEDLPYVDRILQLCLDIYLVRESLEFCLEEDLFAKLIFLYRSPETMIKWTRPKNEKGEDESSNDGDSSKVSLRKKNE